jgi:hypothetical protein
LIQQWKPERFAKTGFESGVHTNSKRNRPIDRLSGVQREKLLDGSLAPKVAPLNIQAGSGSRASNQINLNVVENVTTESLRIVN